MANISAAIRQVRRTRQRLGAQTTENFNQYRPEYEAILEEIADLAGDSAFDELKQWMVKTTKERNKLPTPAAVRTEAREICNNRSVTVPRQSPLRG